MGPLSFSGLAVQERFSRPAMWSCPLRRGGLPWRALVGNCPAAVPQARRCRTAAKVVPVGPIDPDAGSHLLHRPCRHGEVVFDVR